MRCKNKTEKQNESQQNDTQIFPGIAPNDTCAKRHIAIDTAQTANPPKDLNAAKHAAAQVFHVLQ